MAKNQEKTKNDIYNYFKSNGYEPVLKSTSGKEVSVPEEAEVIEFQFKVDDVNYGTAAISLDNEGQLKVFYSDKIEHSPTSSENGEMTWNKLIPALRQMTFGKTKSFELDDMDNLEYDMAKREHIKKLEEGYYPMGKKASYSDNVPECKIVIKHNRNIEEGEQRYRNIHQIFIENQLGERFLAPTTKPGLARVYARHIAEGGKVNDDKWNHITGLCEEYSKMAGFIRATRNGQFNEDTQRLVTAGTEHYISLRESLHKLAGKRGYNNYFESWTPSLMESEESEDLSEMFMNSSLDPRIESVIPILSKLNKSISENQEIKEVTELEEWADNIAGVSEGHGYEHGFASPSAPSLKRQRDHDSGDDEPQGMFTVMINGRPWKEATSNEAFTMAQRVANKHPDKKVAVKWPTGQLNTVKAQGVAEGQQWPDSSNSLTKRSAVVTDLKGAPSKAGRGSGMTVATRVEPTITSTKVQRKDDRPIPSFLQKGVAEGNFPSTDELGDRAGAWRGRPEAAKPDFKPRMTKKGEVTKHEKSHQAQLKSMMQVKKAHGGLTGPKGQLPEQGVAEDIGPQQHAVGQLGATAKVNAGGTILGNKERSQKGLRGKLVGTNESVDPLEHIIKLSK